MMQLLGKFKLLHQNESLARNTQLNERFKIGKYASENGPIAAVRKFEKQFPNMNESTTRTFKKKYESELDDAKR